MKRIYFIKPLPRSRACLLAILTLTLFCNLKADTPEVSPAAMPVIWRLENPADVGGFTTLVMGTPQIVTEAGAKALIFDGKSDGLIVPVNPVAGWARFTIEVLIKPDGAGNEEQRFMHIQDSREARIMMETRVTKDKQWALDTFLFFTAATSRPLLDKTKLHPTDQWHWVALVYDGKKMANFINGVKELEGEIVMPPMLAGRMSIGVRQNLQYWYKGGIREIRFQPSVLAPAALQRTEVK